MTLCPIAIAVGCKKCPIFAVCPVKGVIGDYVEGGARGQGRRLGQGANPRPSRANSGARTRERGRSPGRSTTRTAAIRLRQSP